MPVLSCKAIEHYFGGKPSGLIRTSITSGSLSHFPSVGVDGTMMIDLSSLSFYIGASPIRSAGRDGLKINNHTVTVESGTNKAYVDGTQMTMPVSSFIQNGRTYVPLDFIVQSSGLMLYWREQTEALKALTTTSKP